MRDYRTEIIDLEKDLVWIKENQPDKTSTIIHIENRLDYLNNKIKLTLSY